MRATSSCAALAHPPHQRLRRRRTDARHALARYLTGERRLDWQCVAFNLVAMDLWDEEAWLELASSQTQPGARHRSARPAPLRARLPRRLPHPRRRPGDGVQPGGGVGEPPAWRPAPTPCPTCRCGSLPGAARSTAATELFGVMIRGARARGEGCAITARPLRDGDSPQRPGPVRPGAWTPRARPPRPTRSPRRPGRCASWPRRRRAAVASTSPRDAADRLWERTSASGTAWAMGTGARTRALVEYGDAGESLHLAGAGMAWARRA